MSLEDPGEEIGNAINMMVVNVLQGTSFKTPIVSRVLLRRSLDETSALFKPLSFFRGV